jgi:hypothetical protein
VLLAALAGAAHASVVRSVQQVAVLKRDHRAYAQPHKHLLKTVVAFRPITRERTVLPVLGASGVGNDRWLLVRLPGRPNGRIGWIRAWHVGLEQTPWHIVVSTASRTVSVYRAGRRVRSFRAIVGAGATPTPGGEYFVEETVAEAPSAPGAPFALALSARSAVLQEFDGGPGQIAIHGLANIGGTLGTAVSHGCIRLGLASLRWLARRIDPGTPVTIR